MRVEEAAVFSNMGTAQCPYCGNLIFLQRKIQKNFPIRDTTKCMVCKRIVAVKIGDTPGGVVRRMKKSA